MRQVIHAPATITQTAVLYLGSKEKIEVASLPYTIENSGLKVLRIKDTSDFYTWLKGELESPNRLTDYTILCDYEVLKSENFTFLKTIQRDTDLRNIPFFVHVDQYSNVDRDSLIKLGIDDCLKTPMDWKNVEDKFKFWLKYKKEIKSDLPIKVRTVSYQKKRFTLKRAFDLLVASTLILLLSPLLLIIALIIKLDSKGSIFYKSKRIGSNYQEFDFWKFRSMHQNADERLIQYLHLNQYENSDNNCFFKLKNDPRITRVGRIIRKTSIDELPQLFNVLKGEMSLVGNRPLPPYEAVMMVNDNRAMRFLAPAGLTGLWQVSKRGKADMSTEERVNLDITYAKEHSFWYDIKLLMKTIPAMIQDEDV